MDQRVWHLLKPNSPPQRLQVIACLTCGTACPRGAGGGRSMANQRGESTRRRDKITGLRPAPAAPLSDERIVAEILAGKGAEFEVLVRRHQGPVYNFLLRMLHDPEEALDLTQEVFLK